MIFVFFFATPYIVSIVCYWLFVVCDSFMILCKIGKQKYSQCFFCWVFLCDHLRLDYFISMIVKFWVLWYHDMLFFCEMVWRIKVKLVYISFSNVKEMIILQLTRNMIKNSGGLVLNVWYYVSFVNLHLGSLLTVVFVLDVWFMVHLCMFYSL